MSTDYAKKERAFLDALKADTGHALDEWLAMIDAELLEERNDIIDWMRQHGFTFSRASWIERIHHNRGQPIYADPTSAPPTFQEEPPTRVGKRSKSGPSDPTEAALVPSKSSVASPSQPKPKPVLRVVASNPAPQVAATTPPQDASAIEQTLARAKGLRPLAQHIVAEIKTVVPDLKISAFKSALVFSTGNASFGVLTVSAKDLRLGLCLTSGRPETPFEAPHFMASHARISDNMTHMLVLDDVRQLTPAVLSSVQTAATGA